MKEFYVLLAPILWSAKNSIVRFDRLFYKRVFLYVSSCGLFLFLMTRLLSLGMRRLQTLSPDVFNVLVIKGYSLIFVIIFFMQIVNGVFLSLNTYYQSGDLEVLFTSPVNRISLFFSRFLQTHVMASWMLILFGIPLVTSAGLLYHANIFYYVYAVVLFSVFSTIPVNIGIGLSIVSASIFRVTRLQKVLVSTGIVTIVLLVTLLRVLRPERFVNPELFANLTLFVSDLKTPSFVLLPSRWLIESLFGFIRSSFSSDTIIFLSLLFLTSYILALSAYGIFKLYHYRGWELYQEGGAVLWSEMQKGRRLVSFRKRVMERLPIHRLTKLVSEKSAALIRKDILLQMRDARNIHQMLILVSLIVIYLFSLASIPLNWEGYAVQLKYIISFFNLGLILIILASICSRLVYPTVIAERTSLWVVQTSPITSKRYIMTKFFFSLFPILLIGQLLTVSSSLIVGFETFFIILMCITVGLTSFSLVGMTVIFGISGFGRAVNGSAQEAKTSSAAHMIASLFLILFTLVLEAVPAFLYLLKESAQMAFTQKAWIMLGGIILFLFLVNVIVTGLSMRLSVKAYDRLLAETR